MSILRRDPCEPPSDDAIAGEVKRALSEHVAAKRIVRVAQRPIWPRNAGEFGEPGAAATRSAKLGVRERQHERSV